jgi:hypothetical protein
MGERIAGHLYVGVNLKNEIVINGGRAAVNEDGDWHIVFSPRQARDLARILLEQADEAESERVTHAV